MKIIGFLLAEKWMIAGRGLFASLGKRKRQPVMWDAEHLIIVVYGQSQWDIIMALTPPPCFASCLACEQEYLCRMAAVTKPWSSQCQ